MIRALLLVFLAAVTAAAQERPSDVLFAKYHWRISPSAPDGSASAFVLCQKPELQFRVRLEPRRRGAGLPAYLELYVNGRFISRIDRRGLIGAREGQGLEPRLYGPWIVVSGAQKIRPGMNRVTLVYRGRMGEGDPEAPGPGIWRGEVNFAHARLFDMLRILKGFAQGTGLEAEIYRALQVFDGNLRAALRSEGLDDLDRSLHDALSRSREVLVDPETRRFYAEVDDCYHDRTGERMDVGEVWQRRMSTLDRLVSFWARSKVIRGAAKLYSRVDGLVHDALGDVALARENLRNLYWVYASRDFKSFGPDRFEASLNLGRQNLEVLGDLLAQIEATREALREAVLAESRATGRPAGSDDIRGPYEVLEKGGLTRPTEYTDVEKLKAQERELNLYLTLLADYVTRDIEFLRLELRFLADVIGRPPPEPGTKRRIVRARQKWEK